MRTIQRKRMRVIFGMLCLTATALAQLDAPSQRFQEGIHLMETKGDYGAAVRLFDEIARGPDRALAARALLQLGFCYEKLGNAIARRMENLLLALKENQ